jgi:hypothetical protein
MISIEKKINKKEGHNVYRRGRICAKPGQEWVYNSLPTELENQRGLRSRYFLGCSLTPNLKSLALLTTLHSTKP